MTVYSRNAIRCLMCDEIAESTHVHHMQSCRCGRVSADGGPEYLRRAYCTGAGYVELSRRVDGEPLCEGRDICAGQVCE